MDPALLLLRNVSRVLNASGDEHGEPGGDEAADRRLPHVINFWLLGVVLPVVALLGMAANAASVAVLSRAPMRASTINIYLAGLSAFDGLLLLVALLLYPPLSYCELDHNDHPDAPEPFWCLYVYYTSLGTYPLSVILHCGSVWTLTAITVDRFVAIRWPFRSRHWCTARRSHTVLLVIALWSVLYNLPTFFELELNITNGQSSSTDGLSPDTGQDVNQSTLLLSTTTSRTQVSLERTELRQTHLYVVAYKGYSYLLFMLLIPAGIMVVLNVFVTLSVRHAYRIRQAMSGREEKERRCTLMAVLVVLTFLVFNSLAFANNIWEIFVRHHQDPDADHPEAAFPYLISVSVGNLLVALNSATNFVIYCAIGLRFRRMFCKLFCPRSCFRPVVDHKSLDDRSYYSLTLRRNSNKYDSPLTRPKVRTPGGHTPPTPLTSARLANGRRTPLLRRQRTDC